MDDFSSEFIQGMKDCKDGVWHQDKSDAYNRGFGTQYQHEQNMTNLQGARHGYKKPGKTAHNRSD